MTNELYHYGVKGMKWGVRRYRNYDGTVTAAGKKRYSNSGMVVKDGPKQTKPKNSGMVVKDSPKPHKLPGVVKGNTDTNNSNNAIAKKVAVAALATATVAAAAYAYSRNPQAVNKFVTNVGMRTMNSLKSSSKTAIERGRAFVKAAPKKTSVVAKAAAKEAWSGVKQGVKDGLREGPKTAVKAVITGVSMLTVKRLLDKYAGPEETERIFKANNKKKIDSFWKVQSDNKKEDDD